VAIQQAEALAPRCLQRSIGRRLSDGGAAGVAGSGAPSSDKSAGHFQDDRLVVLGG
jgi:hypothetical protein